MNVSNAVTRFVREHPGGFSRDEMVAYVARECGMRPSAASDAIVRHAKGLPDDTRPAGRTNDFSQDPMEARCRSEWEASPTLRAEFVDRFEVYLHYARAKAAGLVKSIGGRV